ncbi:MAG: NAD(P)-dependent oxidoreductase [Rhodospirillales bacterium]|nr:NAD(P)-dependent oxidoreductase [Rhodospirillales bacterium]
MQRNPNILITGTSSGLGSHLLEFLGGTPFDRSAPLDAAQYHPVEPYETIIHCAFNSSHDVGLHNLASYMDDNASLTERLTQIPHKRFVLASTIDVYPQTPGPFDEKYTIEPGNLIGAYPVAKLLSESHVHNNCPNYLILRIAMMMGPYARRNTLVRVLTEKKCRVGLKGSSKYNVISHETIATFLETCFEKNIQGTFNIGSSSRVTLKELATMVGHDIEFGNHDYHSADIDNSKAALITSELDVDSLDVVKALLAENRLPLPH